MESSIMICIRIALAAVLAASLTAQADFRSDADAAASRIEGRVIEWRRDIHAHPELGNREHGSAGSRSS
jgi:amidohydrolase